jgi:hypothetical protein
MDTKAGEISGLVDEFSKFARETADYLQERAAGLEKNMSKVMEGSGKEFAMKFGEGTKLGNFIETNPRRAAFFALISGLMFTRMLKSKGTSPFAETVPETESEETSKPKMTAKAKAA